MHGSPADPPPPSTPAPLQAASGCARVGAGGPLLLPGWGAEAALKNTEYSAMDDKQQQGAGAKGGAKQREGDTEQAAAAAADPDAPVEALFGGGEAAVVRGFRLDVLAARWGPGVGGRR